MTTLRRRTMLAGLTTSLLTLPFLRRMPAAEASGHPTRFIVFFTPNEPIDQAHWMPGPGFTLTPVMAPLVPHKSKITMVGKFNNAVDTNHDAMGSTITAAPRVPFGSLKSEYWAGGISVDQYIAQRIHTSGEQALTLGARPGPNKGPGRISYFGPSQPAHPFEDPVKAFQQTLGSLSVDDPAAQDDTAEQRRRVLDHVAGRLTTLRTKLGQDDRIKLESHLDAIHDLEASLMGPATPTGSGCDPTAPAPGFDYTSSTDFPITARRHVDVMVQALACGVTRVASLQLGNTGATHITAN